MKGHHQRWLALAWFALCAYGAALLLLFWEDHGPRGSAVAQAENIQCERNWLLLGTRWSCSAIVIDTYGVQQRFTSDSSLLTPADTSVPMQRLGPLDFVPARESFTPAPWPTMGAVRAHGPKCAASAGTPAGTSERVSSPSPEPTSPTAC